MLKRIFGRSKETDEPREDDAQEEALEEDAPEVEGEVSEDAPEPGPPEAEEEAGAEDPEEKEGFLGRFRRRLSRTRDALAGSLDSLFSSGRRIDEEFFEELEEALVVADFGMETALGLIGELRERVKKEGVREPEELKGMLREAISQALAIEAADLDPSVSKPFVIMVVGVNGVGKTTTIAKLAHIFRERGLSSMMVAADTFRAAAVEQLEIWAERSGADLVKQRAGADPAAVAFDGVSAALSRSTDVVLVDTAGRLHTKVNLMEELKKVHRVIGNALPGAPHEVWLVLDATTGQNAINQAKMFHQALSLTGLILTKLDGTAKGGVTVAVVREVEVPLRYIGLGEGLGDLKDFVPEAFAQAIL